MSNTPSVPSKEELLATALQEFINLYKAGKDFAGEQIPDVIRQLIVYSTAMYIVWAVLAIIGLYAVYRGTKVCFDESAEELGVLLAIFGGGGALVVLVANVFNTLKITLAPKVWLIEYAADLVK